MWDFFLAMIGKRSTVLLFAALLLQPPVAAQEAVPFEVVKALKVTRGTSSRNGLLFVDGKFIPPPYVVERYGNVLRINGIQVTDPLIAWSEFLRTQSGAVVSTETVQPAERESPAAVAIPEPEPEPEVDTPAATDIQDWDDPLADLFADEKPAAGVKKKPAARPSRPKAKPKPVVRPPTTVTKVDFDGDFVMNDKAKALVAKLNQSRAKVDSLLREGGFIYFGSSHTQVSGGAGATKLILEKLPELMRDHAELEQFVSAVRASGLGFFSESLLGELFRNRLDYVKLMALRKKRQNQERLDELLR